jgi:WD40 repeat protein
MLAIELTGRRAFASCHISNHSVLLSKVTDFGWAGYLRANVRPSFSLSQPRAHWPARTQVRFDVLTDHAWSLSSFVARPLSRPWTAKLQPILAVTSSRLVVAAGPNLYSYKFGDSEGYNAPPVVFEGTCSFVASHGRNRDITGITFVHDEGLNRTLCIGFRDGSAERVLLTPSGINLSASVEPSCLSPLRDGDFVECMSSEKNVLLSLSSNGIAALTDLCASSLFPASSSLALSARGWTSHLCLHSSSPYAAFGTSSSNPMTVHPITSDQLSPSPSAIMSTYSIFGVTSDVKIQSAVYGISQAPLAYPWGSSPQILVSGWYDGQVRCYDLRSHSRASAATDSNQSLAPLLPVLSLFDPRSFEPIYSVSCGGGSSSHIAAGSARHGVISFWDVRSPRAGWSVYAPGNDPSPVYSVIVESSRVFGVTQSRPFVYDFVS